MFKLLLMQKKTSDMFANPNFVALVEDPSDSESTTYDATNL